MKLVILALAAAAAATAAATAVARDVGAAADNAQPWGPAGRAWALVRHAVRAYGGGKKNLHPLSSDRFHPNNGKHFGSSFSSYFSKRVDDRRFSFADRYANGQPFNTGWSAHNHHITNGYLSLDLRRDKFTDPGSATGNYASYPYTSGELRSRGFYGTGCFTVCMKPSRVSGVTSSFYLHSGPHDVPDGFWDSNNPVHNEIDIEFIGSDTTKMQSNFFSRYKDPNANSGSGVEEMHDLGFNAADDFHAYGFRWTHDRIEWFVDGVQVRRVWDNDLRIPNPLYGPMRINANIWPVNQQAEEWAGKLDKSVYATQAKYKWIKYANGYHCTNPGRC